MWLLNVHTRKLEHFVDEHLHHGKYAILSHTWAEDEVTFQDIQNGTGSTKHGYEKIERTCRQAAEENLHYCWIDTCCIDKTSSAELSEAINSMWRYYYHAHICYARLADVPEVNFERSRWFTRGWTLQELIAPPQLVFYDAAWIQIGTKQQLIGTIRRVTMISLDVLENRDLVSTKSVACRMAWAARRSTSRVEDCAYCLLGLFNIAMPMLYGEGSKAFIKLQEAIISSSTDQSILAWDPYEPAHIHDLLAPSPLGFRNGHGIISWATPGIDESFHLTNKGLRISLPIADLPDTTIAVLNCCRWESESQYQVGLRLDIQARRMVIPEKPTTTTVCQISHPPADSIHSKGFWKLPDMNRGRLFKAVWHDLLITRDASASEIHDHTLGWTRRITFECKAPGFRVVEAHPGSAWQAKTCTMDMLLTGWPQNDRGYVIYEHTSTTKRYTIPFELSSASSASDGLRIGIRPSSSKAPEGISRDDFLRTDTQADFSKQIYIAIACEKMQEKDGGGQHWTVTVSATGRMAYRLAVLDDQ